MPEERIPFWLKPKREVRNLISDSEIEYLRFKDPHEDMFLLKLTAWEKDMRHALTKVDTIFNAHPEECLLSWLCLWKAKDPPQARQVPIKIRASSWGRDGRFAFKVRGPYVYFSRLPKGEFENWTEPQQDAYREQQRLSNRGAGRPKGTGTPMTKVWHCDEGHEWLATARAKKCPHMTKGQPCRGVVLPGGAPGGTLVVNQTRKPVQSPPRSG